MRVLRAEAAAVDLPAVAADLPAGPPLLVAGRGKGRFRRLLDLLVPPLAWAWPEGQLLREGARVVLACEEAGGSWGRRQEVTPTDGRAPSTRRTSVALAVRRSTDNGDCDGCVTTDLARPVGAGVGG